MARSLKEKTVNGLLWSVLERFSAQGTEFLVILILANILLPKDFGLVGMLTIFVSVARSLVDSGFSQALIRKQERTNTDNCTVFYFNIVVSIGLYGLLCLVAPWVSAFYHEPQLCSLMRALCFVIVVDSFSVVQRALFTSKLDFKTQTKASFFSSFFSGVLSYFLATKGFGCWSLVVFQLSKAFLGNVFLWYYSTWRPKLLYSWSSFIGLFSFGSKLMVSGVIDTIYNNLYQIVIGKFFSASSLGHFSQAKNFSQVPASSITSILQNVTYPTLCRFQDDNKKLKESYEKLLRVSAFVVFPLMCGIAGLSSPLVYVLIGSKWSFAASLIIPLCFSMIWYPIHALNLNLLKVKGRSDLFLKIEVIKKAIGVVLLFSTIPFGITVMCWFRVVNAFISLAINTYYTGNIIDWGFWGQLKSYSNTLLVSLLLFTIVLLSVMLFSNPYMQLFIGMTVGFTFFILITSLLKFEEIKYIKSLLTPLFRK